MANATVRVEAIADDDDANRSSSSLPKIRTSGESQTRL